jgi:hypothetical protein
MDDRDSEWRRKGANRNAALHRCTESSQKIDWQTCLRLGGTIERIRLAWEGTPRG